MSRSGINLSQRKIIGPGVCEEKEQDIKDKIKY